MYYLATIHFVTDRQTNDRQTYNIIMTIADYIVWQYDRLKKLLVQERHTERRKTSSSGRLLVTPI